MRKRQNHEKRETLQKHSDDPQLTALSVAMQLAIRAIRMSSASPRLSAVKSSVQLSHPHLRSCFDSGSDRTRLPVAAKIALHSAGTTGGSAGSPRPVGGIVGDQEVHLDRRRLAHAQQRERR